MLQRIQMSRRRLLKGLGMGAGLVAVSGLSGCTQFLQRAESSVPLAPARAGGKAGRKRLAEDAKQKWKTAFLTLRNVDHDKVLIQKDKFEDAVASFNELVSDYIGSGLAQEVDRSLRSTSFLHPNHKELEEISRELREMAVPQTYIIALRDVWFNGNRHKAREHILEQGGTGRHWQRISQKFTKLISTSTNAQSLINREFSSGIVDDNTIVLAACKIGGPLTCAAAFAAAAYICSQDAAYCEMALEIAALACILALLWNGCFPS